MFVSCDLWQVATSSRYWMLFCLLMMTHVSHSGSFELRLNSTVLRDWRLKGTNTSIGCVLSASCLWKKKLERERKQFFGTNSTFKHVAQGETL